MVNRRERSVRWFSATRRAALFGVGLFILFGLYKIYTLPATTRQSRVESPDHRTIISVDEKLYGIGELFYVVRIGPGSGFLNWAFVNDIIEVDDVGNAPASTAYWIDDNSAMIVLPVKPDRLGGAIRKGLESGPAIEHYRSVHIIYQAR